MHRSTRGRPAVPLACLLLAGALLGSSGCGSSPAPTPAPDGGKTDGAKSDTPGPKDPTKTENKGPATPKAAMIQAAEGLIRGNEEQLFRAVQADDMQKDYLRAMMRFQTACDAFRTAFVKAYGQKAWDRFNDPNVDPSMGEGYNTTLPIFDVETVSKAKVDETGDEAVGHFTDPSGGARQWKLVKTKVGWRVDAATMQSLGAGDVAQRVRQLDALTALVKKYQRAIGKPDVKPDDIDVELDKAMKKQLLGITPTKPPRFDIDKFKE